MKHLTIILTILLLYSCNLENQSRKKKDIVKSTVQIPNLLIGEWSVNKTIIEGAEILSNVCPKISFNYDQTAVVILPSGDKENLKWTVNSNILIFTNIDNENISEIFPDSLYEISFIQNRDYIELELKQIEKKYSEILRR